MTTRHAARLRPVLASILAMCAAISLQALGNTPTQAAPSFKVLAFYSGTFDAAHIDFEKEARVWYANLAAQYGFSFESTNDWSRLNTANLAQYKVIMTLDYGSGSQSFRLM
jgi:hypothetical protein